MAGVVVRGRDADFSARRDRASLPDLLAELYRETAVDFVASRLPGGERILQNLSKAAGLARAFEWGGAGSLKLFLSEIRRKTAEGREEDEVPDFEEGEDAVRIFTIHAAKGLEFPVVILGGISRGGRKGVEGLRADRVHGISAVVFPGFRTWSAFRQVPGAGRPVAFEEWEREKMVAEERRLLYVASTRARDRLFIVEGGRGAGSDLLDALRAGIDGAPSAGGGKCVLTGLRGERLRLGKPADGGPFGGEMLVVPVAAPPPSETPPAPSRGVIPSVPAGGEARDAPAVPPPQEPVTLAELYDRSRGIRFGEKVHRVLEAFPPVASPWPPPGATPPVEWGDGEELRWDGIAAAIRGSGFFRRLAGCRLAGTELPLLRFRSGASVEERADLIVRASGPAGEYWVVDYKTGEREPGLEESHFEQVREYMGILSEAWGVPVRGFVWYLETGEALEVS